MSTLPPREGARQGQDENPGDFGLLLSRGKGPLDRATRRALRPGENVIPARARGFALLFADDAVRLRNGSPTLEDLVRAANYWTNYPFLLAAIRDDNDWPQEAKAFLCYVLDCTHIAATYALMHEAAQAGFGPDALYELYECGCVVRNIYNKDPAKLYPRGADGSWWPECMDSWRYDLPECQQAALRNGEEIFLWLRNRLYTLAWAEHGDEPKNTPAAGDKRASRPEKGKRAERNARLKLGAALTKHHQYANGSCLNVAPIGSNELAHLAGVSQASASRFFKRTFGGHCDYRHICMTNTLRLIAMLQLLNGELPWRHRPLEE